MQLARIIILDSDIPWRFHWLEGNIWMLVYPDFFLYTKTILLMNGHYYFGQIWPEINRHQQLGLKRDLEQFPLGTPPPPSRSSMLSVVVSVSYVASVSVAASAASSSNISRGQAVFCLKNLRMMMGRRWVEMMDDHGPPRVRKPLSDLGKKQPGAPVCQNEERRGVHLDLMTSCLCQVN